MTDDFQKLPEDPIALTNRFNELRAKSRSEELTVVELRELIEITRTLRKTNTGPAKARKGKTKLELTDAQLDDLI